MLGYLREDICQSCLPGKKENCLSLHCQPKSFLFLSPCAPPERHERMLQVDQFKLSEAAGVQAQCTHRELPLQSSECLVEVPAYGHLGEIFFLLL